MLETQNAHLIMQQVAPSFPVSSNDETGLEQILAFQVLGDYNEQLASIAKLIESSLVQKKAVSTEIAELANLSSRELQNINGSLMIEVSPEEANHLKKTYPELQWSTVNDKDYLSKNSLQNLIMSKQQNLAALNGDSEMMTIKIQSLIDQRKTAVTMLSNMISSKNEMLLTIARNLKQ